MVHTTATMKPMPHDADVNTAVADPASANQVSHPATMLDPVAPLGVGVNLTGARPASTHLQAAASTAAAVPPLPEGGALLMPARGIVRRLRHTRGGAAGIHARRYRAGRSQFDTRGTASAMSSIVCHHAVTRKEHATECRQAADAT